MSWVRLDDGFPHHPKFVGLSPQAGWLWVCALAWCNRYGTDGHVKRTALRRLVDMKRTAYFAEELVKRTLWERDVDGNFTICGYLKYQPSAKQKTETREIKSKAGKIGAQRRWQTDSSVPSPKNAPDPTRPDPTRPVPSRRIGSITYTVGDLIHDIQSWNNWPRYTTAPKRWEDLAMSLSPFTAEEVSEARDRAESVNGKPSFGLLIRKIEQVRRSGSADPGRAYQKQNEPAPFWKEADDLDV